VPGDPAAGTGFQSRNATVAYTEANLATIDFVKDVLGVLEHMESTGYRPTTIVMTRPIFNLIVRSPKMTNFLYPSSAGQTFQRPINESDITRALGIDRLLIAAAHADRSKTKGTTTLQPIWNNNYIFFSDPKGGDFQEGGVGRTLVWNEEVSSGFFNTMSYRWEKNRTNRIRVHSYFTTHVIDYFSGVLVNLQP
jgi:hypothetical protein